MAEPYLRVIGLSKRFGDHDAVADLSLWVERGSVLALLGPSGSGKTTILRLLAGFERPDAGVIEVDGRDVTSQPPVERRFGMVFQHYALFPHLTVYENVAFGLSDRSPAERQSRAAEVLSLVDLEGFGDREVTALSGGQQQRVAVARALAPEPRVLLLDEPLSNLDPGLRERTRRELRAALVKAGVTTVFVTHEQEEAFALGDRIAVLRDGALEQVGTARELYEQPSTEFVATFVGRASVLHGVMVDGGRVRVAESVEWPADAPEPLTAGQRVSVVVRPEAVAFTGEPGLEGTVTACRYTGARAFFTVAVSTLAVATLAVEVEASVESARAGDVVRLTVSRARCYPEGA
jgi:ABC-type Fe3+/spermidine/putrescine transport system ATPase subunit